MALIKRTMTPGALAAQRANAEKSTGPRSRRGKNRASLNAIRTGRHCRDLREKLVRLGDSEALAVYDAYAAAIKVRLKPRGSRDLARAERLVREAWAAWWVERRSRLDQRKAPAVWSVTSGAVAVTNLAGRAKRVAGGAHMA